MAQSVKYLSCKHGGPESDPYHSHKMPGMTMPVFYPTLGKYRKEDIWASLACKAPNWYVPGLVRVPVSKKIKSH